jgi:hypothetical protein
MGSGLSQKIICPEVYSDFHQSFQQRPWTFRDRVKKCLNKLNPNSHLHIQIFSFLFYYYEGESKIISNVDICCAVGYTAGWT